MGRWCLTERSHHVGGRLISRYRCSTVICGRVAHNRFSGEKTARVVRNGEEPAECLVACIRNLVWIVAIVAIAVFWLGL